MISKADCKIVLKRCFSDSGIVDVKEYEVKKPQNLRDSVNSQFLLVIKAVHEKKERQFTFNIKWFENKQDNSAKFEIFTYGSFIEELRMIPGSDIDFAPKGYVTLNNTLIFQNLSEDEYMFVENAGLDQDTLKLALHTLAKFHSGGIVLQEKNSQQLNEFIDTHLTRNYNGFASTKWTPDRLNSLFDAMDLLSSRFPLHVIFRKELNLILNANGERFYNIISHGNLSCKTIMFKYQKCVPIDCKIIDFCFLCYAPPAHDVLQLILLNTTSKQRQHYFHKLVEFYYECLLIETSNVGIALGKILPLEDFKSSIACLLPKVKLLTLCKAISEKISDLELINFLDNFTKSEIDFQKWVTEVLNELYVFATHCYFSIEDCHQIVQNILGTTQYDLLDYKITPVSNCVGYLGEYNNLNINIRNAVDETKTFSLFVKCFPRNKLKSKIAKDGDGYFKEKFVYIKLVGMLKEMGVNLIQECLPSCYLARKEMLVFKNLDIKNYLIVDIKLQPFSCEMVQTAIKTLSKYHACSIIFELKMAKQNKAKFSMLDHYKRELHENVWVMNEDSFSAKLAARSLDAVSYMVQKCHIDGTCKEQQNFEKRIKQACQHFYELVKPSEKFRNVMCHGDLWFRNIMIKYHEGLPADCRLIDFQYLRYCPPAHDLLFLIYATTDYDTRKNNMWNWIEYYHKMLSQALGVHNFDITEVLSYKELVKSCHQQHLEEICHALAYLPLSFADNIIGEFMSTEDKAEQMLLVDRTELIDRIFEKEHTLKQRIQDMVNEAHIVYTESIK